MESVFLTLKHFQRKIQNKTVLIRCDYTTVVQYINKQGGTKSPRLCYQTWDLWNWAISQNIKLKAAHITGKLNALVDHLSRVKIRQTEWMLNKEIVQTILQMWGHPLIDMFASVHNRQTQIFCTWYPHNQAYALDALSIPWEGMLCISPIMFDPQSSSTYQTVQLSGYSDSSILAEKALVHRTTSPFSGCTIETSKLPTVTSTTKHKNLPSKRRSTTVNCMASIDRGFKEKGFYKDTRTLLAASWRSGTQKDYACKFEQFNS